ncbi:Acylphosphatase [Adhaeretor mobilis]|uniref:Acylphosphatase n=1 Tax=Adhaeretor mobilis TaxID=1930276 RepID=A0A517MU87_9BACT|nr:Acylphosphatase [Adhaeretor mobilis]
MSLLAGGLPVTGYVENLPDGRVHLIADGNPEVLDQLISAIAERMAGNIEKTESSIQKVAPSAAERFADFTIRR